MARLIISILFLASLSLNAQQYIAKDGEITFFSEAPLENISAINKQVSAVYDNDSKEIVFQLYIKDFIFPKALMQEHFNENYMESDIYPNASFKGRIKNWGKIDLTEASQEVTIDGTMEIHGVSKEISEKGRISLSKGNVIGYSNFQIMVADYDIEIPRLVRENIAKIINVDIELVLKKK